MHSLDDLRSGRLAGLRQLDLSGGLTEVPPEVFGLAETLEVLNLSGNRITSLPDQLPRLRQLRILFCSYNDFTHLPEVLGECPSLEVIGLRANRIRHVPASALPPSLRSLVLTDNELTQLPPTLGLQTGLQKIMLAGNRLTSLPDSLQHAEKLELLRISANQLNVWPAWLAELPRLAWLAMAGNPWPWQQAATLMPRSADWTDLILGERLGEGASGVIHRVAWRGESLRRPGDMALKLFKNALTSDGRPADEIAANLVVGAHAHLCTAHAYLNGHPDGTPGLLMPLLPPTQAALAGPPSLDSCTRDVYPSGTRFTFFQASQIAAQVAQAAAHLHARHVLHGDLYAHNTLWDPATGQVALSDLGAACCLPSDRPAMTASLCKLDVLAFGILLSELCKRVDLPAAQPDPRPAILQELANACCHPRPADRPAFAEVLDCLAQGS